MISQCSIWINIFQYSFINCAHERLKIEKTPHFVQRNMQEFYICPYRNGNVVYLQAVAAPRYSSWNKPRIQSFPGQWQRRCSSFLFRLSRHSPRAFLSVWCQHSRRRTVETRWQSLRDKRLLWEASAQCKGTPSWPQGVQNKNQK